MHIQKIILDTEQMFWFFANICRLRVEERDYNLFCFKKCLSTDFYFKVNSYCWIFWQNNTYTQKTCLKKLL